MAHAVTERLDTVEKTQEQLLEWADLEIHLDVLFTKEEGEWCAIALDMSLRGYGKSREDALDDLLDAVHAQVTFALEHDTLDNIFIPADQKYFERYNQERLEALKRNAKRDTQPSRKARSAVSIPFAAIFQRRESATPAMQFA